MDSDDVLVWRSLVDDSLRGVSTREVLRRAAPGIVVLAIAIAIALSTQYDGIAVLVAVGAAIVRIEYVAVLVERGIVYWDSLGYRVDGEVEDDV